jgi:hypothetical protein
MRVKPHSIVTYDGDEYPLDIIIWSTGYQIQTFPLPIYGTNGRSLADQWAETMQVNILQKNPYLIIFYFL